MGEVIAVLSGKGGTGKTAFCAGVATALAEMDQKVLCIDLAVGLRDLDIFLGMEQENALSFCEVCRGEYTLHQAADHPDYPNLKFLTAPVQCTDEDMTPEDLGAMLRRARQTYDYILLDAPAGLGSGFSMAAQFADRCVVVAGYDAAAIRAAARVGQILELMGKRDVRMVVSRIQPKLMSSMKLTVDDLMDRAGLQLLGIVEEDPQVTLAAAAGQPLLHRTQKGAAAAYIRIAKRLQGISVRIPTR